MIYLLIGLVIGLISGFAGTVIYLRTYLRAIEKDVKNFRVVYNIKIPPTSTSLEDDCKDIVTIKDQQTEDLFRPF